MGTYDNLTAGINPLLLFGGMGSPMAQHQAMGIYQQMAPLRAASMLERTDAMQQRMAPAHLARAGNAGNFSQIPGQTGDPGIAMDPRYQEIANKYLSAYGMSMPTSLPQNTVFPNSGFFGAHPRLSGAIEGALYAGANTPGSDTWGEGMQSVLRGVLGGRVQQANARMAPVEQRFHMANQLESLRDLADKHEEAAAMIKWHTAQAEKAAREPIEKYGRPVPVEGGAWVQNDPEKPWTFQEGPGGKLARAQATGGFEGQVVRAQLGEEPAPGGPIGKDGLTAQQRWGRNAQKIMGNLSYTRSYNSASGSDKAHLNDDTKDTITDKDAKATAARIDKLAISLKPSQWMSFGKDAPRFDAPLETKRQWLRDHASSLNLDQLEAGQATTYQQNTPIPKKANPFPNE